MPEFSVDYSEARRRFTGICDAANIGVESHRNPKSGPRGEVLYTDCAVLGPAEAKRVLVVNSATHGVEGFCGSAALSGWLRSRFYECLPPDTRVVLIHALNPYGFAWLRRVNEENVDLNRNFVGDHTACPDNTEYEQIHRYLLPCRWDGSAVSKIRQALERTVRQRGLLTMQSLICRGQYLRPDGVFYGGDKPGWSHMVFMDIVRDHVAGAKSALLMDFHTGLGSFGEPELICAAPPDDRIRAWFTDRLTCARLGNAVGPSLSGTIGQGIRRALPDTRVYSVTVEFGTYDIYRVLNAILADNWLHVRGDPGSDSAQVVKREIRECFYPDSDEWRRNVHTVSQRILAQALNGISGT